MSDAIQMKPVYFAARMPIEAYGDGGFRFGEFSHKGAIMCFPTAIYAIELAAGVPTSAELQQFFLHNHNTQLLLLGTGMDIEYVPDAVRGAMKAHNCALEIMNTGAAVRTYNVLLAEERDVAAILYPV